MAQNISKQPAIAGHVPNSLPLIERPVLSPDEGVALGYFASVQAAASLRSRGQGPRYAKVGKKVIYRRADLDEWVRENLRDTEEHARPRDAWLARRRKAQRRPGDGRP